MADTTITVVDVATGQQYQLRLTDLGSGVYAQGVAVLSGGGSSEVEVTVLPALPAGDNNIGDVDVVTLPSLPAGNNNIGDVDVVTLPSLPVGDNNIGNVDVETEPATAADDSTLPTEAKVIAGKQGGNARVLATDASGNLHVLAAPAVARGTKMKSVTVSLTASACTAVDIPDDAERVDLLPRSADLMFDIGSVPELPATVSGPTVALVDLQAGHQVKAGMLGSWSLEPGTGRTLRLIAASNQDVDVVFT